MMSEKDKILESWIMVEHLSEGDINLRDKSIQTFNLLEEENYYALFMHEMEKKKVTRYKNCGVVIYFDIFPFKEIVDFLNKQYNLTPTGSDVKVGDKFSVALYFTKDLKLDEEKTFLTASYYIRNYKKIPREQEFAIFEGAQRKFYEEIFTYPEDKDEATQFNHAVQLFLQKNNFNIADCRMKVVTDLKSDATNLHSFFISDLEKAKHSKVDKMNSSDILDTYILGTRTKRVNLDSRMQSEDFNATMFQEILQPSNYPIARFPSNPNYALTFMQQVAVNLAIGYDNEQIRSVNGPPGTGKTTLLKDIFAQLVVEQSYEMTKLSKKFLEGSEKTKYYNNARIGILPNVIAEKGIIVASSNNGAVQNIVKELPLTKEIAVEFQEELQAADYFRSIANSQVSSVWKKGADGKNHEELISVPQKDPDQDPNQATEKFWGLFSMEGGRKDNMDYIVTVLKHVVKYLEGEYVSNPTIYEKFRKQYKEIDAYKQKRQKMSGAIKQLEKLSAELNNKWTLYTQELENTQRQVDMIRHRILQQIQSLDVEIDSEKTLLVKYQKQLQMSQQDKGSIQQCIDALSLQKPGFFSSRTMKREYADKIKEYSGQLQNAILTEQSVKNTINTCEMKIDSLSTERSQHTEKLNRNQQSLESWKRKNRMEMDADKQQIESLRAQMKMCNIDGLDLSVDYETLQSSNPWFDSEYRYLQSQLFITALQVRKQFLYENVKNIKASYLIWTKQQQYLSQKRVISEAWNWINLVIPVISSTFASFSRMCANLEAETMGYLFVDEAGQALPQASVGAIFRSRNVMVVGDPSQIKPVLTLDPSILSLLAKHFEVSEKYLSDNASTQTLVDDVSKYGFYKDINHEEWIGVPLWVHRRCKKPMFDISNQISYGGNMVLANKVNGISQWYDIKGSATDKYVKEQGTFLIEKIQEKIAENKDILDRSKKDTIYVITPFKNVAYHLAQELKKIGFTRYDDNGKPTNVGTVHTFQGKEAPIVFLVLGADQQSRGAANWAMGTENPNIMNVATTRAKEEFYIIGDKKLYLDLKSDVIDNSYQIIDSYNSNTR